MFAGAAGRLAPAFSLAISLIAFNLYSLLMAISYEFCFRCHRSKTRAKIKNWRILCKIITFALLQKFGAFQNLKNGL
jgi:uncharacterized membrane protein